MTWQPITCTERDALMQARGDQLTVASAVTDLDGTHHAQPRMETTWHDKATDEPVLHDTRHPARGLDQPDTAPCEHYEWKS